MNPRQSISVVIPVHDGERYLAAAIASVLAQTCPPTEIIVVDDGSTDDSGVIARAYGDPVRLVRQSNRGPAAARNAGIQQATGDILAFLDADDLWVPDKLTRQVEMLCSDPAYEAVSGHIENFLSPDLDATQCQSLAQAAQQGGNIHVGALLIWRTAFVRVGYFDEQWRQSEFVDWWGRAQQARIRYAILPALVLRRRLHMHNLTRRERTSRHEYVSMLRQHLLRQRSSPGSTEDSS